MMEFRREATPPARGQTMDPAGSAAAEYLPGEAVALPAESYELFPQL
jgi:hypothetical protein